MADEPTIPAPPPNDISESTSLTAQAQEKAKRLDDGTPKGAAKARLILALNRLRLNNRSRAMFLQIPGVADNPVLMGQKQVVDDQHAAIDAEIGTILTELDALGVKVNLSRTEGYR